MNSPIIDRKAADPKAHLKAPLELIPPCAAEAEAFVLYHGAVTKGRGKWNWRQPGQRCHLMGMVAAIERHCLAIKRGEWLDPESGKPHMAHIRAGAGIVMDAMEFGSLVDDRPLTKDELQDLLNQQKES